MKAYKLFRIRKKDNAITSLFINKSKSLPIGVWLNPEKEHKKDGFAFRPFWHCTEKPIAPHLKLDTKTDSRKWFEVEIEDYTEMNRPLIQGGRWFLANKIKIIKEIVV